ncbi:TfoX/Sxy family protein [Tropicibacter sp. R15_0]|nr:TfoX/Sxy family protein [Tropicibacter sp. R15_0]
MAISEDEIAFALELFEGLGPLTTRKMFGGLAIYCDGVIFAIVMSGGVIRLKGQGEMVARFESLGLEHWTYQRPGQKPAAMPYWTLPDSALEDPDEACDLARAALHHL